MKLKDPKSFTLMGKDIPRLDIPEKVNGSAVFGMDVKLPGLLTARVARCPVFGGKVASFNADKAKAVPGVKHVVQISNGVAVVADNYYSATKGFQALEVKWDEGKLATLSSADILKHYAELAQKPGKIARNQGNADNAFGECAEEVRARLRSAVPRPRDDGADELHGGLEAGQLRRVCADAGPDRVAHGRDRGVGSADGQGEDPHDVPRRRIRPSRRSGLRRRSRRDLEGRRRAGQGDLVARRRHAARLLPADQLRPHVGRGRRVR